MKMDLLEHKIRGFWPERFYVLAKREGTYKYSALTPQNDGLLMQYSWMVLVHQWAIQVQSLYVSNLWMSLWLLPAHFWCGYWKTDII